MQTSLQASYQHHQVPHHYQQQHEKHSLYYLSNEPTSLHDEVNHQEVEDARDDMHHHHHHRQGLQEQPVVHHHHSGQEDSSSSYGAQYAAHFGEPHIEHQYEEVRAPYQHDDGPGLVHYYPASQPLAAITSDETQFHVGGALEQQQQGHEQHHLVVVDQTTFAYDSTSGQAPIDLSHHEHAETVESSQIYYDLSAVASVNEPAIAEDRQNVDATAQDHAGVRVPDQFTTNHPDHQDHAHHDHYHNQLYSYPATIGTDTAAASAAIHTMIEPPQAMHHDNPSHQLYTAPDLYAPAPCEQQQYTHVMNHNHNQASNMIYHDINKYEEQTTYHVNLEPVAQYHSMHHPVQTHDIPNGVDDDARQHRSQPADAPSPLAMEAPPRPSQSAALSLGGQHSSSSQCCNEDDNDEEGDEDEDLLDSDLESIDSQLTRDEKKAREANIPLSYHEIVNLSIEQFNEHIVRYPFSEAQLTLMKDIRRRGKNKVAAQTCRKRKMEQISELQLEVAGLVNKRAALRCERARLSREHARLASEYERLYTSIQGQLAAQAAGSEPEDQKQQQVVLAHELTNSSALIVNVS